MFAMDQLDNTQNVVHIGGFGDWRTNFILNNFGIYKFNTILSYLTLSKNVSDKNRCQMLLGNQINPKTAYSSNSGSIVFEGSVTG